MASDRQWCNVSGNPKNMPGGLTIWDMTEPTEPKQLVCGFGDLDVHGDPANGSWHLLVSDWDAGWIDIDVSDPSNPQMVADFDYARSLVTRVWSLGRGRAQFDEVLQRRGSAPTAAPGSLMTRPTAARRRQLFGRRPNRAARDRREPLWKPRPGGHAEWPPGRCLVTEG